jgi:hypothetical protein
METTQTRDDTGPPSAALRLGKALAARKKPEPNAMVRSCAPKAKRAWHDRSVVAASLLGVLALVLAISFATRASATPADHIVAHLRGKGIPCTVDYRQPQVISCKGGMSVYTFADRASLARWVADAQAPHPQAADMFAAGGFHTFLVVGPTWLVQGDYTTALAVHRIIGGDIQCQDGCER